MVRAVSSWAAYNQEEDRVKAQGLVFLGVRTTETDVMAAFFTDVMGLPH
jgi:hypothetical protein